MYDNGIFVVIFLTLTFCKHRPVRNIRQPVIPLTDCDIHSLNMFNVTIESLKNNVFHIRTQYNAFLIKIIEK